MKTGKAAVLVKPNQLETWEVPVPDPADGGVLVKVVVGGVCGSDVHITAGETGEIPIPIILGHEGVGRLEKLGAGVDRDTAGTPVKLGDLVYWMPIAICHRCYSCSILEVVPCENSTFFEDARKPNWGSYAEYACLPPGMAFFRVPDGGSVDAIAALGCALPTALGGVERAGGVQLGQTVVVQGAGPVGLSIMMVAALSGARSIIVIDGSEARLQCAKSMGATATVSLSLSAEERQRQIMELSGPSGPDLIFEATGALPAFSEGVRLTGHHGRYTMLGLWGERDPALVKPTDLSNRNLTIAGHTFHKPKHYYRALHLAVQQQDRFPLAKLITHRFGIAQASEALAAVQSGVAVKALIDPAIV